MERNEKKNEKQHLSRLWGQHQDVVNEGLILV